MPEQLGTNPDFAQQIPNNVFRNDTSQSAEQLGKSNNSQNNLSQSAQQIGEARVGLHMARVEPDYNIPAYKIKCVDTGYVYKFKLRIGPELRDRVAYLCSEFDNVFTYERIDGELVNLDCLEFSCRFADLQTNVYICLTYSKPRRFY
jgi:hypothetical protein